MGELPRIERNSALAALGRTESEERLLKKKQFVEISKKKEVIMRFYREIFFLFIIIIFLNRLNIGGKFSYSRWGLLVLKAGPFFNVTLA